MKTVFGLILFFVILTFAGENLSAFLYQVNSHSFENTLHLMGSNILFFIGTCFVMYLLDMLRLKLIGKIFSLNLSWQECFGGVCLNLFFGWISPMAILGAPATAFYLCRRGYPVVTSISVSFARSFVIIFTSAITTMVIYLGKFQGVTNNPVLQEKVFWVLTVIGIYILSLIVLSYVPLNLVKKNKFLNNLTEQIRIVFANGTRFLIPLIFISLILNFMLVSFIFYKGAGYFPGNESEFLGQVMIFLSYMLLMPTPGASGLAEVGAPLIFSHQIPQHMIISIVTASRFTLIGLQIFVGLCYMSFILKEKFTLDELKKFRKDRA